jgi:hypothetical protein
MSPTLKRLVDDKGSHSRSIRSDLRYSMPSR